VSFRLPAGLSKDDITPRSLAHTDVCGCEVDMSVPRNVRCPRKLSFPLTLGTSAVCWPFFIYIPSYSVAHFKITELHWTTVFRKFRLLTMIPVNTRRILRFFFHSKPNCSYMIRLVLNYRQAVYDFIKRKYTVIYVILLKMDISVLTVIFMSHKFKTCYGNNSYVGLSLLLWH
jgi:hypothetical protein